MLRNTVVGAAHSSPAGRDKFCQLEFGFISAAIQGIILLQVRSHRLRTAALLLFYYTKDSVGILLQGVNHFFQKLFPVRLDAKLRRQVL